MVRAAVAGARVLVGGIPAVSRVVTAGAGQLAAAAAEGGLEHVLAQDPLLVRPVVILQQVLDHRPPGVLGHGVVGQLRLHVGVAVPDARHAEGGGPHEPQVVLVVGGAGLAEDLGGQVAEDAGSRTPGPVDGPLEQLVHHGGVIHGHDLLPGVGLGAVVQDHIAVVILHIGVGVGLVVHAAVGEDLVGGGELPHGDAVGQAAQGHRRQVGVTLRVQGGEVQLVGHPVKHRLGGELLGQPRRRGVLGLLDGPVHVHAAGVVQAVVGGALLRAALAVVAGDGDVVEHRAVGDGARVDAQGIGPHRLDGRAGLPGGLGGVVVQQPAAALVAGADDRHHLAGVGVHHKEAQLDGLVRGEHVRVLQEVLLHVGLQVHVHGAVDLIAGVVDIGNSQVPRDPLGLRQVPDDVLEHGVDVPVPLLVVLPLLGGLLGGLAGGLLLGHLLAAEGHGVQLGHGGVVLVLGDVHQPLVGELPFLRELQHAAQHGAGPVLGLLGVVVGIVLGGVLGDAGDQGALRQRALADVLAEVVVGRGLHPLVLAAVVYQVQVGLQDLLFGVAGVVLPVLVVAALHVQGGENLFHLPQDGHLLLAGEVLHQLLGDGGAAPVAAAAYQAGHSPHGVAPVHTMVLVEPVVLNADLGGLHLRGDVRQGHPHPVLIGEEGHILHFFPVVVGDVHLAGEAQGRLGQVGGHHVPEAEDVGHDGDEDQQAGDDQHQQHRLHRAPGHATHGFGGGPGGLGKLPLRPLGIALAVLGVVLVHIFLVQHDIPPLGGARPESGIRCKNWHILSRR